MKNLLIKLFAVVFTLVFTVSVSADNQKPDLWKVEKDGVASYLFGSIHAGSKDMYPMSPMVMDAYNKTSSLVVEVDLASVDQAQMAQKFQKYGMNPSTPLEARLSPETLKTYKESCSTQSLPCQQFAPFKPWALSTVVLMMKMQQLGYTPDLGIDMHFLKLAHSSNKNIINLETVDSQLKLLSSFNQAQEEKMLVDSLKADKKQIDELFNAWKNGDDNVLMDYYTKGAEIPEIKDMYVKMLDVRNIQMVASLSNFLDKKQSLFVVVGAMHMIGEKGIVNLLREKDYSVIQIQ